MRQFANHNVLLKDVSVHSFLFDQIKSEPALTFIESLRQGVIPEYFPNAGTDLMRTFEFDIEKIQEAFALKGIANHYGMWAIVDKVWTANLAHWIGDRKVLEVMAGVGWLAQALSEQGVTIEATDDFSWDHGERCEETGDLKPIFTGLKKQDAIEAAESSDADILLLSWPPYQADDMIEKLCDVWGNDRPIIYIGERPGGCNACDALFERYESQPVDIDVPRHIGINDRLFIFQSH